MTEKPMTAYITFGNGIEPKESAQQVSLIETPNGQTQVTINVDSEGYLPGVRRLNPTCMPII